MTAPTLFELDKGEIAPWRAAVHRHHMLDVSGDPGRCRNDCYGYLAGAAPRQDAWVWHTCWFEPNHDGKHECGCYPCEATW